MTVIQMPPVQAPLAAALASIDAGLAGRVFENIVPPDRARPYAVWTTVTAQPENFLGERPLEDDQRVQCDFYAQDQPTARRMMQAGADALEGIGYIVYGPWETYEPESRLFRWSFDFEVWNVRG